ncbi:MAG: hypothetical protein ACTSVI_16200 [Promethearchaeota archaeon]
MGFFINNLENGIGSLNLRFSNSIFIDLDVTPLFCNWRVRQLHFCKYTGMNKIFCKYVGMNKIERRNDLVVHAMEDKHV